MNLPFQCNPSNDLKSSVQQQRNVFVTTMSLDYIFYQFCHNYYRLIKMQSFERWTLRKCWGFQMLVDAIFFIYSCIMMNCKIPTTVEFWLLFVTDRYQKCQGIIGIIRIVKASSWRVDMLSDPVFFLLPLIKTLCVKTSKDYKDRQA